MDIFSETFLLSPLHLLVVAAAGFVAGVVNVVAGGGSLVTVPVLILLGLPPTLANGTNRIAILSQNAVAISRFKAKGYFPLKLGLLLGACSAIGAIIGSNIAVEISDALFQKILAGVLLVALAFIIMGKNREAVEGRAVKRLPLLAPVFFFIGIYGGFIQAGTGFLIMGALSLIAGADIRLTNSIKVMVVFLYTIPTILIFLINKQIAWAPGIILALGNTAGAWLGVKISAEGSIRAIKIILSLVVVAMAARLFFFQ